jgi:hypothetical protein
MKIQSVILHLRCAGTGANRYRSRGMKRSTLKHLGDQLRERMRPEDTGGSEELRKLVEKLEQSERELGRIRFKPFKPRSKRPQGGR